MKRVLLCFLLAAGLSACGVEVLPPGNDNADRLSGTWTGFMEDTIGQTRHDVTMVFDADGNITSYQVDLDPVETGSVFAVPGNDAFFFFDLPGPGITGGLAVNGNFAYGAFLNDARQIGVMQRNNGTDARPFALAALNGAWSGNYIEVDVSLTPSTYEASSVIVDGGNGNFNGSAPSIDLIFKENFNPLIVLPGNFGRFSGDFINTGTYKNNETGTIDVILSPDGQFAGSYACSPDVNAFPDGCGYNIWNR